MHILVRDGLCDRDYLAAHTLGFERLEAEVLPRFAPARVAEITGAERRRRRAARPPLRPRPAPFIRLGEGMSRSRQGGQALRAVALLPGVTGAYGKRGGGALLMTAAGFGDRQLGALRKPSGPARYPPRQPPTPGRGAARDARPADPRPASSPATTRP